MPAEARVQITITEEHFPRYDPAHGTPDPMVRRFITMQLTAGAAKFEQTDYGHPRRFNAWEPRGVDAPLQPRTEELRAICASLTPLLK